MTRLAGVNLEEFARVAKGAEWSAGDDVGFHMDVDAALSYEKASFRRNFEPADTVATLVFEIEWFGEGTTVSDIDRDIYRLCGRFAEGSMYIGRAVSRDHVVYDVIAGNGKAWPRRQVQDHRAARCESCREPREVCCRESDSALTLGIRPQRGDGFRTR